MPKIRVHQLAKELDMANEAVVEILVKKGRQGINHFSTLDEVTADVVRRAVQRGKNKTETKPSPEPAPEVKAAPAKAKATPPKDVSVPEPSEQPEVPIKDLPIVKMQAGATVKEFGEAVGKSPNELIRTLMTLGEMVTINQPISQEAIDVLAEDLGIQVEFEAVEVEAEEIIEEDESLLEPRPPVITVMGHVDHGKTSLLDAIRKTDVISGEAGGITQHIGAYQIAHGERKVTFIDTPGHEAFTAMRARGAQATDIAVVVVAADDGVMPQTLEAIDHARAAGVPIVIAVNKIDKPGANPDKVKQELSDQGLMPEAWGGDTVFVDVSAKEKTNLNELVDMLLLVADMRELKANPNALARGVTIEAKLDKGRGPVATVLVQRGSLRVGDAIVSGQAYGKIRALLDDKGRKVKVALPAQPVEILGFSTVPAPGDTFKVMADERKARQLAEERALRQRVIAHQHRRMRLEDLYDRIKEGEIQDLNIILKGDVQGSVEAVRESLGKINQAEVKVNVIHGGVGAISETDVMLAAASSAIIIGFNVRPTAGARQMAEREKVDIRLYRVIYKVVEDINAARVGMLTPQYEEKETGHLDVRQTFKVPKIGLIAGCFVTDGEITNKSLARLVRDGTVIYEGKVESLRRFKEDAKSVKSGYECGVGLENFKDLKEGDVIEVYEMVEIARTE